jgi:DNA adenine methylase
MRPPLTYYGGKQQLAGDIISLIPDHHTYCEPFFGGGAVFFAKEPSKIEVINDTNGELINFYRVVKTKFRHLQKEIKLTLYSRAEHRLAKIILEFPELVSDIKRAWAIWVLANQSYGSMIETKSTWGYDKSSNTGAKRLSNKRNNFTKEYAERLEKVQIENIDALRVIETRDSEKTFFYCDPPYFNSDCGHYDGYSEQDYENLLKKLSEIKGKFLLSSYPNELLEKYAKQNKWFVKKIDMPLSIVAKYKTGKRKTEVLAGNYPLISKEQ